jgi:ribosomal protein L32
MFELEAIFTITGPRSQYEMGSILFLPYVPQQGMELTLFPQGPTLTVEQVRMNVSGSSGSIRLSHHYCFELGETHFAQEEKRLEHAGWKFLN